MNFFEKLQERVNNSSSLLCIGLDPHVSQLPQPTAEAAKEFCLKIVRESHPFAAAFKPNIAFFECFGEQGYAALREVIHAIPKDIPIVLDCKRGDIDTTAQAYAMAAYDVFEADCVTLSPFMGWDSIHPFVTNKYSNKGAFVLCKTSNKSSKDVQEIKLSNGDLCYERVIELCEQWNQGLPKPMLGLVAGATDTTALQQIRKRAPNAWILCPGVGAQGGDAKTVCDLALREDGSGLLISVSRNISKAANIHEAAKSFYEEINQIRQEVIARKRQIVEQDVPSKRNKVNLKAYQKDFIQFAIQENVLKFGSFKLKSGRMSPYFFNAGLFNHGKSLSILCRSYAQAVKDSGLEFDVIFGPAYKGIPLVTAFSIAWYELFGESKDICYNRKEAKDHGEGGVLVGAALKGRRVLIIDDVITAGTAIREALDIIQSAEGIIIGTVVCLDRQEKATEDSSDSAIQQVTKEYGFPVLSIIQLDHLISYIVLQLSSPSSAESHSATIEERKALLTQIESYRSQYGVK